MKIKAFNYVCLILSAGYFFMLLFHINESISAPIEVDLGVLTCKDAQLQCSSFCADKIEAFTCNEVFQDIKNYKIDTSCVCFVDLKIQK